MAQPAATIEPPEYEKWPKLPVPPEVLEQLERAEKYCEDLAAGRVERGVDAFDVALAHARPFAPGEIVGHRCGEDDSDES